MSEDKEIDLALLNTIVGRTKGRFGITTDQMERIPTIWQ